ncbi:MAG: hypothetical protein EOO20_09045 [Chryseobacterium sp.]|nr:MAG: hypothetical protein EOO20_09045 [Chryseobacterium sp.]
MKGKAKCIRIKPYSKTWRLHQKLGQFAQSLNRRADLSAVRSDEQKSAPPVGSGNGFLSHSFSPLVNGYSKEIQAASRVAESIFSAARNLCDLYGIKQLNDEHLIYPQNVSRLVEDL